jgi:hypothetical protein
MFVCAADGSSFTRCISGVMSAPIPMAASVKCTPGQDPNLKMVATKRAVRFGAEHVACSNEAAYLMQHDLGPSSQSRSVCFWMFPYCIAMSFSCIKWRVCIPSRLD